MNTHELSVAKAAFERLTADALLVERALHHLERWIRRDHDTALQLRAMMQAGRWETLLDAFGDVLAFGTGGRRGPVGLGPRRINPATVRATALGHAAYLKRRRPDGPWSVVMAWDVREFTDTARCWVSGVPNPTLGLTSRDLGLVAAQAYREAGVTVWVPDDVELQSVATPVLSFAIRYLGADGGLNITASHNPPDDNGLKVYDQAGVQVAPPEDDVLMAAVMSVSLEATATAATAPCQRFGTEVLAAYHAAVLASVPGDATAVRVAFSSLHGCGVSTVAGVLGLAGATVSLEAEQCRTDGRFPTLDRGIANPEDPSVMQRVLSLAREVGAQLALVTDPDADRLGAAVPDGDDWRILTGDELAALTMDALSSLRSVDQDDVVLCTAVTSRMVGRVARASGATVVDCLPVGFKFIGRWADEHPELRLLLGAEESHGLLVTPELGDKDAAGAALVLCCFIRYLEGCGETLAGRLSMLQRRFGPLVTVKRSVFFEGVRGRQVRAQLMQDVVRHAPELVAGSPVLRVVQQANPEGPLGPIRSESERVARGLVSWVFDEGRLAFRPSGTEPKLKLYAEASSPARAARWLDDAESWIRARTPQA